MTTPNDTHNPGRPVSAEAHCSAVWLRNWIRNRQTEILKECDKKHGENPLEREAWSRVVRELDKVADECSQVADLKNEEYWADHYFRKLMEAREKGYLPDDFDF